MPQPDHLFQLLYFETDAKGHLQIKNSLFYILEIGVHDEKTSQRKKVDRCVSEIFA